MIKAIMKLSVWMDVNLNKYEAKWEQRDTETLKIQISKSYKLIILTIDLNTWIYSVFNYHLFI